MEIENSDKYVDQDNEDMYKMPGDITKGQTVGAMKNETVYL